MSKQSFIPMAVPVLGKQELSYVTDAVKSGWISSQGRFVNKFEEQFSTFCGMKYGIAVCNGTVALHLALATLGVTHGDEVITSPISHIATVNAITLVGAKILFIDSERTSWNMDPDKIEEKITPKTKAILVVHLYGHPMDMFPVIRLARKYKLFVIEDAAEAHGAEYKGNRVGGLGDIGCFSFYANKIITTGEGGMLVSNNKNFAEKARKLRDQAYEKKRRFWHKEQGFNYRMTNVQAAIGVAQMKKIDKFIAIRRRNAHLYNSLLSDVSGITLPPEKEWAKNVYWMYSILIDKKKFGIGRDTLCKELKTHGIDSRRFFYPIHLQPLYHNFKNEQYPIAEKLSRMGLNLPSGNELTQENVKNIAQAITQIHQNSIS